MPFTQVDFAIAAGTFLIFIAIIFSYMVNYLSNYQNMASASELRGAVFDIFNTFFTGVGIPGNWYEQSFTPVKVGLMSSLYRVVTNVTETSGANRDNIAVNGTVDFDSGCSRNVLSRTVRLYDSSNSQIPFQLYNQTFCSGGYIRSGEIVFNISLTADQTKFFYIYFSSEKSVAPASYSVDFPINETGYSFQAYPAEDLQMISIDRLQALRLLNYTDVIQTLMEGYKFHLEISK